MTQCGLDAGKRRCSLIEKCRCRKYWEKNLFLSHSRKCEECAHGLRIKSLFLLPDDREACETMMVFDLCFLPAEETSLPRRNHWRTFSCKCAISKHCASTIVLSRGSFNFWLLPRTESIFKPRTLPKAASEAAYLSHHAVIVVIIVVTWGLVCYFGSAQIPSQT